MSCPFIYIMINIIGEYTAGSKWGQRHHTFRGHTKIATA
nr:MAG TPA: hypothetical protein [Caudoviricetes sp.]